MFYLHQGKIILFPAPPKLLRIMATYSDLHLSDIQNLGLLSRTMAGTNVIVTLHKAMTCITVRECKKQIARVNLCNRCLRLSDINGTSQ